MRHRMWHIPHHRTDYTEGWLRKHTNHLHSMKIKLDSVEAFLKNVELVWAPNLYSIMF